MSTHATLKWQDHQLILLDQTMLPNQIQYRTLTSVEAVFEAIRTMVVRGAPAIGVAAAYGMVLAAQSALLATRQPATPSDPQGSDTAANQIAFQASLAKSASYLATARPTAVNLQWAVDRMMMLARADVTVPPARLVEQLEQEAIAIHEEDICINRAIGENLLSLLKAGDTVLTHCNAGALATSAYGTALSVFYLARERGIDLKVFADETRPRLQGARLTAFELHQAGIDVTLISDNMAAVVMAQGKIDAVIVGCDRIAANGDTANKIGTFGVSILARHFGIPLYIAAPTPTIDLNCPCGAAIPIEERSADEIRLIDGTYIAPENVKVYNPAFDVTPAENITAIVTEKAIVYPPFQENLQRLMQHE
jgi:methylthioribose-1-phosphate isomerase